MNKYTSMKSGALYISRDTIEFSDCDSKQDERGP